MLNQPSKHIGDLLNPESPNENLRRDLMSVAEVPSSLDQPVGVYLVGMYGSSDIKHSPVQVIPEHFRGKLSVDQIFIVTGNLLTQYASNLRFIEFERAPEPDPNDGLA